MARPNALLISAAALAVTAFGGDLEIPPPSAEFRQLAGRAHPGRLPPRSAAEYDDVSGGGA